MNMSLSFKYLFYLFLIFSCITWCTDASIFEWIWPQSKGESKQLLEGPLIPIPFELKTDDEKFLEEATKFSDIIKSSELDICQHKIILKIKVSCSSMTEEELAKMSVNLLNCQSAVDGRQKFSCTDSMTLKECTQNMDPAMWNAYHMMNNRARAVCLSARRSQFQALSEMTVNKLMSAAHNQIKQMNTMVESQDRLERLTQGTMNLIKDGNVELLEQQNALKINQRGMQDLISHSLHDLVREKALIATGHKELIKITQSIKDRMDGASQQLNMQSEERLEHHKQLIADIENIQKLTEEIFHRIDISTDKLLHQHSEAAAKYEEAVINLAKINETIHYLLHLIDVTRSEIDEKFLWIQNVVDITGIQIGKLASIAFHIAYLLLGMLFASFLNFPTSSRIVMTSVVLLNLMATYMERNDLVLDYSQMTILLVATALSIAVFNRFRKTDKNHSSVKYHGTSYSSEKLKDDRLKSGKSRESFLKFFRKLISSLYSFIPSPNHWFYESKDSERENAPNEHYVNGSVPENGREIYEYDSPTIDRYKMRHDEVFRSSLDREWLEDKLSTASSTSSRSGSLRKRNSVRSEPVSTRYSSSRSRGDDYRSKLRSNI